MGLFYVRVDVRSHVNNGPLNNLCIVCMWRCIVSWCSLISPCEWCGFMKMGDCEPSYGYGKAHVVSGHWFSPWHTGREPDLSNPFQGLFSRMPCGAKGSRLTVGVWGPGVCSPAVSAHVRARTLWQGRWGTVPKGVRGGKKGEGCRRGSRGERGGGGGKGIRVRGLSCFWPGFLRGFLRGFWLFLPPPWTVQNGSERFRGIPPWKRHEKPT